MAVMAVPMLSLAGVPGFSGYVSKTLLHEAIVEYIHLRGGSVWFTAAEWIFLLTGGLTAAYLLKLFAAVFLEPTPPDAPWLGQKNRMSLTSGLTLTVCTAALLPLGWLPNRLMEPLAAFTIPFLTDAHPHAVSYFTAENLRGAVISLIVGLVVYLWVVRRALIAEEDGDTRYLDRWPKWLSLEDRVYRPLLLKVLPFVGGLAARLAETLVDGTVALAGKLLYHRQTRTVEPEVDPDFAAFSSQPPPRRGFRYSFAYSLMLMGLGMAGCLLYLILS